MARFKTVISWSLRVIMAGLFLYAGFVKAMQPDIFLRDIESYRLLPYQASLLVALYLPWLEITAGLALLLPSWSRASAGLLAGLMTVFLVAIISAWARGLDISCGCFGATEAKTNYPWLMLRDCLMLAALLIIVKLSASRKRVATPQIDEHAHSQSLSFKPEAS